MAGREADWGVERADKIELLCCEVEGGFFWELECGIECGIERGCMWFSAVADRYPPLYIYINLFFSEKV